MSALQLLLLVAVLRHAVVLVLRDVEEVDVAVLVLQQLRQLLQPTKSGESYECSMYRDRLKLMHQVA